jgi:hypothetical protein
LRRLARQAHREETVLINSLALGTGPEPEDDGSEEEKGEEYSEDELAPTQPVASRSAQKGKKRRRSTAFDEAQLPPSSNDPSATPITTSTSVSVTHAGVQPIPNTPNPAANLLQFVQFPQTPAGQQAQSSFYATLAQTINNAVQQAVAPLFSSILPNTPRLLLPFSNALPLQTTPAPNTDRIAPAKDPKWFFPPLSDVPRVAEVADSTPVPAPFVSSPAPRAAEEELCIPESDPQATPDDDDDMRTETISTAAIVHSEELAKIGRPAKAPRRTSPRVEVQRQPGCRARKYIFTAEDDIYIWKRKALHNRTWTEIRDSKKKWKNWHVATFQQRFNKHLKGRNFHVKGHSAAHTKQEHEHHCDDETAALAPHHLPTPSSSGHEDDTPVTDRESDNIVVAASNAQFDDDERDLLSLAGADFEEEQLPLASGEEETFFPDADEVILPSVEQTQFVDEDALQQGLLEDSTEEVDTMTPAKIKSEMSFSSPTNRRKRTYATIAYQAVRETDTEADVDDHTDQSAALLEKGSLVCNICNTAFKTAKKLQRHQANSRSTHDKVRPKSASIDLVGDDELQVTVSATPPKIKREFSTPPPTSFLFSTPAALSHSRPDVPSSGAKPASGLSRKAYLKQIKQSWTKKSTPASNPLNKRKSFPILPRKRAWADVADSDDELAS